MSQIIYTTSSLMARPSKKKTRAVAAISARWASLPTSDDEEEEERERDEGEEGNGEEKEGAEEDDMLDFEM